ncbi:hypothetical protein ACFPRL_05210 [Pseudoclavibacter helvolus]
MREPRSRRPEQSRRPAPGPRPWRPPCTPFFSRSWTCAFSSWISWEVRGQYACWMIAATWPTLSFASKTPGMPS